MSRSHSHLGSDAHVPGNTVQRIDAEDIETVTVRVDGKAGESSREKEADRGEPSHRYRIAAAITE